MKIEKRITSYIVTTENAKEKQAMTDALRNLLSYTGRRDYRGKFIVKLDKRWYGMTGENSYLLPDFALSFLIASMNRFGLSTDIDINEIEYGRVHKINRKFLDKRKAFPYQLLFIREMTKKKSAQKHLINLQTGKGKTTIALRALRRVNGKTLIVVLAQYIKKWKKDIEEAFDVKDGDIISVHGGDAMKDLLGKPHDGKFILISTKTFNLFYKEYEETPIDALFSYDLKPHEFRKHLGIDTLLLDESHREFYNVYKTILYVDPKRVFLLSATFYSQNKYVTKYMELAVPKDRRHDFLPYDRYITVHPVAYKIYIPNKYKNRIVTIDGYNNNNYEDVILHNHMLKNRFLELVKSEIKTRFLDARPKGAKTIIYFSTVNMCEVVLKVLKPLAKEYRKTIKKYTQEDPSYYLYDSDIVISTLQSAGEAIDKKGVTDTFNFVNIKSPVKNEQVKGRTRKEDGIEMKHYYYYNLMIDKHKEYDYFRRNFFKDKSKTIIPIRASI